MNTRTRALGSVFAVAIVILSTMSFPVAAVPATLVGSGEEVAPGDNATVSFTITNDGSEDRAFIVNVTSLPDGFSIVSHTDDGGVYKESATQWLFQTVSLGTSNTSSLTLSVPESAQGTYSVEAEAVDASGVQDTTTAVITVDGSPNADAGSDRAVDENTVVGLDGTASTAPNGDSLNYSWTQTGGPSVDLSDNETASPNFTAPEIDADTTFSFQLEVMDGRGGIDTDTVNITVEQINEAPTADAGPDQTVNETTEATLDARDSSDPDGDSLSLVWTQTSGPDIELLDNETATPSFTAPEIDSDTTLSFQVEVSDGNGGSDTDTANVTVAQVNQPPIADAGDNQSVNESTTVTLSAAGSDDPDGDGLNYSWTQTSGPSVELSDSETESPEFTTPTVSTATDFAFQLEVSDGNGGTDTDSVTVTVGAVNDPPSADAGPDQEVDEEAEVQLNASNTSDPDGDVVTYTWEQISGPSVTLSDNLSEAPNFTAPEVDTDTTLAFEVTARDGNGGTDTDTVNVTVATTNNAPVADAGSDQTVNAAETVQLDGTGSIDPNDDDLTYTWSQVAGPSVELSESESATPTFVAPDMDTAIEIAFELEVSDGDLTDTDSVTVIIEPSLAPANFSVSDLSAPASVTQGDSVTITANITNMGDFEGTQTVEFRLDTDGSESLEESEVLANETVTLASNENETLTFDLDTSGVSLGTYTHGIVTENDTAVASLSVDSAVTNQPPVADAGEDQTVDEESTVQLNASESSDPDGDSLSYTWTQTGGPDVTLSDANTATPSFTTPAVEEATDITFEVTVSDGQGGTATETVTVTVQPATEGKAFFAVTNLSVPDEVAQGESLSISATITNTGGAEGTQLIEARVDANRDGRQEVIQTESVTLASGNSTTVTTTRTVPANLSTGTYTGGLFTFDSNQTTSITVVSSSPPDETYTRDEIAQAKYDLNFTDLSNETARQVEELYLRQPFDNGSQPEDIKTREEIAQDRYGEDFEDLSRETTIEIQSDFDAQFGDTGDDAEYTRDGISQAKYYGYNFSELSAETAGQVEELHNRQPFADGLSPSNVQTREEIANQKYGIDVDELSRETRLEVEQTYHEQFNESDTE